MSVAILIMQISILLGLGSIPLLIKSFLSPYLQEKGKNLATKEDIESITKKVENIKAEIEKYQSIFQAKYQLKFEVCLEALKIVDAHLSHKFAPQNGLSITKQFATTEQARDCHSKLILACENPEILTVFSNIMFGFKDTNIESIPPTDLLNNFRNLIRKELGFGEDIILDRDRAWFGKVICEPEVETENT